MNTIQLLAFVATLPLAGALGAQESEIWLDSRVSKLPTDKLGPFVHTSDGKVLAIDGEATFISDDGGKTWSEPRPLTGATDKNIKVSNERAMMRTKEGTIIAAFMNLNERNWTWSNEIHDAPGAKLPTWVMRSENDGKTWNHVQKMHDDWTGAVRDMIQTKDGRIIFTAMKFQHDPGRHAVLTYSSTDDGKTWKASNLIDLGGKGHHGGVTEPTLTELPDGRLWMLIRTNWGEFWSAYSHDGGRFWRIIQPSGIAASSAPGLMKRLQSGRLLLVWNRPFPEGKSEWELSGGDGLWSETPVSNHRDELSLAMSDDDGKTWSDPVVVARSRVPSDAKKNRWIAYPYVFEYQPGELWLTTMQGHLRIRLLERDFVATNITSGDSTTSLISEALQTQSNETAPLMAYVGTFSSPLGDVLPTQVDLPPGNGRGIHLFQVNRDTGAMVSVGAVEMGTSPSCLVVNATGTRLYSSNETDRVGQGKQGTVSAFSIDAADGQLTLLGTVPSGGDGPTYVSIHPSGLFLLVANYFGGSVAVLPILSDGRLGKATDIKIDAGEIGPTKATHAPPGSFAFSGHDRTHAHMIQADPSGRFVLHVDLGLDKIFIWKFDEQAGTLTPNEPSAVSLPAGDGPRHFHFHPAGRWLYSIQEEGSTIALFDYDAKAGRLSQRQTISSLPPGYAGSNFCSEILVSSDGKFVYAGNRLHDSIGIFSVGQNGELTFVGDEWTRGNYPRSFNFDPTGRFLYSCNQRADNIAVFEVNHKTGGLHFTGHYTPVGNPSSIVFRDLAKVD